MGGTSAKVKNNWNKSHYDRLTILIQKGEKEKLARIADEEGIPISRLFVNAVNEKYPGLLTTLDKTLPAFAKKPREEE